MSQPLTKDEVIQGLIACVAAATTGLTIIQKQGDPGGSIAAVTLEKIRAMDSATFKIVEAWMK